jgi:hypothetical protein
MVLFVIKAKEMVLVIEKDALYFFQWRTEKER